MGEQFVIPLLTSADQAGKAIPSMRLNNLWLIVLCVALAACAASNGDYPSLALRDAERAGGADRVPSTDGLTLVNPAPPSPAIRAEIRSHIAAAQAAHRRFRDALPNARNTVASGRAPVESDAYAAAQVALGNLQSIRSDTAFALADLDAILAARSNALQSTEEAASARAVVATLLREENAALAALERQIR